MTTDIQRTNATIQAEARMKELIDEINSSCGAAAETAEQAKYAVSARMYEEKQEREELAAQLAVVAEAVILHDYTEETAWAQCRLCEESGGPGGPVKHNEDCPLSNLPAAAKALLAERDCYLEALESISTLGDRPFSPSVHPEAARANEAIATAKAALAATEKGGPEETFARSADNLLGVQ